VKINMVLVYHAAAPAAATTAATAAAAGGGKEEGDVYSNLLVSSEYIFDLESHSPFFTVFDVASPCPALPPTPSSKIPRALQGDDDDGSTAAAATAAAAAYTFYTGEQVLMRLSIKALQPSSWGESQGGGRLRIEQVVWHPVKKGNWATTKTTTEKENGGGRVLYSLAQDGYGGGGEQDERGMQPQDVLSLTFPFLCPEKESSQALPLGRVRLYWRVVPTPSSPPSSDKLAAVSASSSSSLSSWLACTEADCPSVGVVAPDVTIYLQAPLEATLGRAFKLRWTLRNLTGKVLTQRVLIKEGGGGNSGPSTEEALVWSGARESVVQVLPQESLQLRYCVVPVLTGPIALPRLVLTRMPDGSSSSSSSSSSSRSSKKGEGGASSPLPLRVAYRYVDNVLSNSALLPSTPGSAENRGGGTGGQSGLPSDTRHLFVFPEAAHNQ